jgi:formylmethanofuran dehydrogenase subunit E
MYAPEITQELIDKATAFHGHWCGGLARGIRVAAWAMEHFGTAADEEIVAVTETDMCAVDAIQALVGCTFGKGNLIFRDRGKVAFTFFRRRDGKSARLVEKLRDDEQFRKVRALRARLEGLDLQPEERKTLETELAELRQQDMERLLSAPFETLFDIKPALCDMPGMARRLPTLICEDCGEGVMSTRIVEIDGRRLCMDCAEKASF